MQNLTAKKNRNKFCYSCANATERCFRNEIGCPCQKYKFWKEENTELKLKLEALEGQTPWKDIKDKSELIKENAELKSECRTCIYTDTPCVLSDYEKSDNGVCSHYKNVFEENEELKVQIKKLKSYANVSLPNDTCYKCGKKLSLENRASVILTSNPPKYLCKECAREKEVEKHKWNDILLGNGADYDKKIAEEYTTLQERITNLEKENTELKEKYVKKICDCDICDTYCNSQLTEAKEIIKRLMDIINHDLKCFDTMAGLDVKQKAMEFLKEKEE